MITKTISLAKWLNVAKRGDVSRQIKNILLEAMLRAFSFALISRFSKIQVGNLFVAFLIRGNLYLVDQDQAQKSSEIPTIFSGTYKNVFNNSKVKQI